MIRPFRSENIDVVSDVTVIFKSESVSGYIWNWEAEFEMIILVSLRNFVVQSLKMAKFPSFFSCEDNESLQSKLQNKPLDVGSKNLTLIK